MRQERCAHLTNAPPPVLSGFSWGEGKISRYAPMLEHAMSKNGWFLFPTVVEESETRMELGKAPISLSVEIQIVAAVRSTFQQDYTGPAA